MASRFESIPEDFLNHLVTTVPGFGEESCQHQFELARMAWIGMTKSNQHSQFDHAMTFWYKDLDSAFGRSNFSKINSRLNFFNRTPGWSLNKGYTRGYFFSEHVRLSIEEYLARAPWESTTRLLMANGNSLKSTPSAVTSKDKAGVTTRAWVNAKGLKLVTVDLKALDRLKVELLTGCDELRRSDETASAATHPALARVERVMNTIGKVSRLSMTEAVGAGRMAHHYEEAQSGRLYPIGISLASAQTVVKDAALTGNWEYDIANCHFAILEQMASKSGYECHEIPSYLNDKEGTRNAIAEQVGITPRQAKTCLVALLYGARASAWHKNAIPREIGTEAAELFCPLPTIKKYKNEINQASKAILLKCPRTPKRGVMNIFGKSILVSATKAQQVAHLLQGVEAKALQAVINAHPDDIVLVQHDGFVSSKKLDADVLSEAIFNATGYHLSLEEKLLKVDVLDYFGSR